MIKRSISHRLGMEDVYIVTTRDGSDTLFSRALQVTYHSIYGAVSESKHTYIQYCLQTQSHRSIVRILEFGFGTGLNAFLAFLYSQKNKIQIDYSGIEAFPLDASIAKKLDYPGYLAHPERQSVFDQMHEENSFMTDHFQFNLLNSFDITKGKKRYDCIFFDAFDPAVQPELWDKEIFEQLYDVTSPGGCLVTYSAKGEVRRNMIQAGYDVNRIHGAPGKRQMLQAFRLF